MNQIAGVQMERNPATGRLDKLTLDVAVLMENPAISEAMENLLDVLALQAVKERKESGRPWEDVKKELDNTFHVEAR